MSGRSKFMQTGGRGNPMITKICGCAIEKPCVRARLQRCGVVSENVNQLRASAAAGNQGTTLSRAEWTTKYFRLQPLKILFTHWSQIARLRSRRSLRELRPNSEIVL